jgi:hypothetical protein
MALFEDVLGLHFGASVIVSGSQMEILVYPFIWALCFSQGELGFGVWVGPFRLFYDVERR